MFKIHSVIPYTILSFSNHARCYFPHILNEKAKAQMDKPLD